MLLPTSSSKLLAEWQGPYQVLKKVGMSTIKSICMTAGRVLHVNMLCPWCIPKETSGLAEEISDLESDEVPVWKEEESSDGSEPGFGDKVSEEQCCEVRTLLGEVIKDTPGRTSLAQHQIRTGEARPIRLPPYRIPHAYRDTVKREIKEMF